MRGIEISLRREAPTWVGYEEESRRIWGGGRRNERGASEAIENGVGPGERAKKDLSREKYSRWDHFVNGISCFFAFRLNLGWSNSLAKTSIVPPFRRRTRLSLLVERLLRLVAVYTLWDILAWIMGFHPTFKSFDRRLEASIWERISLGGGRVVLSPVASAVLMVCTYFVGVFSTMLVGHHIICLVYTLFHPGRPVAAPPLFGSLLETTSVSKAWSQIWHQVVRGSFLFIGGNLVSSIARQLGQGATIQRWVSIFAIFALSAIQHGPLYSYGSEPQLRSTSSAYVRFFLIQPAAMALERAFLAITGRKVGGPLAALWTRTFLIWAGIPVVEGSFRVTGASGFGGGEEGIEMMPFGTPFRSGLRLVMGR